jgi:hypothetical protein
MGADGVHHITRDATVVRRVWPDMDQFCEVWVDTRDEIAWRQAQGKPITEDETKLLDVLDDLLDRLDPHPHPGLDPEVKAIVEEVLGRKNKA